MTLLHPNTYYVRERPREARGVNFLKVLIAIIIMAIALGVLFAILLPGSLLTVVLAIAVIAIGACLFFF